MKIKDRKFTVQEISYDLLDKIYSTIATGWNSCDDEALIKGREAIAHGVDRIAYYYLNKMIDNQILDDKEKDC